MTVTVATATLRVLVQGTRSDTDDVLNVYIGMATRTVAQLLADKFSDEILSDIALQLAGHYWVLSRERGGMKFSKIGQSEESYQGVGNKTVVGFLSTRFGQAACALDTTGTLATAVKPDMTRLEIKSYGYGVRRGSTGDA